MAVPTIDFSWKEPRKGGDGARGREPPAPAAGSGELNRSRGEHRCWLGLCSARKIKGRRKIEVEERKKKGRRARAKQPLGKC